MCCPPGIGDLVWAGMKQNLSLRLAPYKVELTDARGMNFYVPLDKDMFIRASSTPSPRDTSAMRKITRPKSTGRSGI